MTTIIKVDVLFNIPEEWELAEQFKESHPEFLELDPSFDAFHFQFNEIQFGKNEPSNAEPIKFYGVFNRGLKEK